MTDMKGFMHGVNLGGWLSQCNHQKSHYEEFIIEKDLQIIKSWGLDHVRLPVDYNLVQNNNGEFLEEGFVYIQRAIDWCKNAGLNLILDLHKTLGYSFDKDEKETGLFGIEKFQKCFYELWEQFAKRFGKYESMLCFELLNEVTEQSYSKAWNAIAKKCIERIRKIAPEIRILVGSYWNNHVAAVRDLDAPFDKNIVYNFHCYEPLIFTHQGAGWIPKMNQAFRMKFDCTFAEYDKFTKENIEQPGDNLARYDQQAKPDYTYFEKLFADAIKVAEERGVRLYCGEYGVINRCEPEELVKWYKAISEVFNKHGIGRAAWTYKNLDFGLSDKWIESVRGEVLKLL